MKITLFILFFLLSIVAAAYFSFSFSINFNNLGKTIQYSIQQYNHFSGMLIFVMIISITVYKIKYLKLIRRTWKTFASHHGFTYIKASPLQEYLTQKNATSIFGEVRGSFESYGKHRSELHLKQVLQTSGRLTSSRPLSHTVMVFSIPGFPTDITLFKKSPSRSRLFEKFRQNTFHQNHQSVLIDNSRFDAKYEIHCKSDTNCKHYFSKDVCIGFLSLLKAQYCKFSISNSKLICTFTKPPTKPEQLEKAFEQGSQLINMLCSSTK